MEPQFALDLVRISWLRTVSSIKQTRISVENAEKTILNKMLLNSSWMRRPTPVCMSWNSCADRSTKSKIIYNALRNTYPTAKFMAEKRMGCSYVASARTGFIKNLAVLVHNQVK